jgi:cysteine-rich secretory family protein
MRSFVLLLTLAMVGCGPAGTGPGGGGGSGGGGANPPMPGTADAYQQHNLDVLNMYRAQAGVGPLVIDDKLNAFSTTAAMELEATGQPHGYFMAQSASRALWNEGFCTSAAENQAPGWPTNGNEDATIDAILKAMMDEGPGGGHHDNILAASSTRVGIGLVIDGKGQLWFSNDFSGSCH